MLIYELREQIVIDVKMDLIVVNIKVWVSCWWILHWITNLKIGLSSEKKLMHEESLKLYFKRFLCITYTINYQRLRTSTLTKKRYFLFWNFLWTHYKSPFSRSLLFLSFISHGWKILPLTKLFLVNVFHPHLLLIFRM